MPTTENPVSERQRARRRRIIAAGEQEVLFKLSNETVALIDEIKERQGLRNRGEVLEHAHSARELLKLFEQRREAAQQQ
jgi:UDP-N-acetylmuramyl tripeptide synthase